MNDDRTIDLLTIGETMGLVVSDEVGPLTSATRLQLRIGGAESNVAIGAARLGARARWVSRLGTDGLGDRIERTIRGEGVDVVAPRDPDRPTGLMLKEHRTTTHTSVLYYRSGSAASAISADDIHDDELRAARVLHLTGITAALSSTSREAVVSLAQRARDAGCIVSYDINYRARLMSRNDAATLLRELAPAVGVLFGGLDELALVDDSIASPLDAWRAASALGVPHLVVKDGANGASAFTVDRAAHQPAYPITAIDTVGAGDAFVAGYLTALLEGVDMTACLDRGARAGALLCMVVGDWEGSPSRAELALLDVDDAVHR
jgi:2-dehydro-3-deoxygluconokinase